MNKINKILLTTVNLIFVICILILIRNPVEGAEISIYQGTPVEYWLLLFTSFVILIYLVFRLPLKHTIIPLFVGKILFLATPYIRGYFLRVGDVQTHYGIIYDIIQKGLFVNNWYPVSHITIAEISLITNIHIVYLLQYSVIFVSFLTLILCYLISKKAFPGGNESKIIFVFALILLSSFNTVFTPTHWTVPFFFLLVYLLVTSSKFNPLLILIISMTLVITHPLGFLAGFSLLVFWVVYDSAFKNYTVNRGPGGFKPSWASLTAVLVAYLTYMMDFRPFVRNMTNAIRSMTESGGRSPRTQLHVDRASDLNLSLFDWVYVFLSKYFMTLFAIAVILITIYLYIYNRNRDENLFNTVHLRLLTFLFLAVSIWGFSQIGVITPLNYLAIERLVVYFIPIAIICFIFICKIYKNKKHIIFTALTILLLFSFTNSFSNTLVYDTNEHTMYSEQIGYMTIFDHPHPDYYYLIGGPHRYLDTSFGYEESRNVRIDTRFVPEQFGYKDNDMVAESLRDESYIVLTELFKLRYVTVLQGFERYSEDNFKKINSDSSANLVYSNGEFTKYFVVQPQ